MGFIRSKTTGFTAIIPTTDNPWRALFLRDDRVAQINQTALVSEGLLTAAYSPALSSLPEPFASCSDAAFSMTNPDGVQRTVFIAGDMCLEWAWGVGAKYTGPVTGLPNFGSYLPAAFRSDVDVVMGLPGVNPTYTLLIKGDQATIITSGQGASTPGPLSGLREAGWKKLTAPMNGDFDHAVMLPTADGSYQTLFIKGESAMRFDWSKGPTTTGTYAQVLAGLGALPAAHKNLRLPPTGRFRGTSGIWTVDLRVDLAGALPVVSGDIFATSNGAEVYQNSFVLDGTQAVALPSATALSIPGTVSFAFPNWMSRVAVSADKLAPGGTATVTVSAADGSGLTFVCFYTSRFLRSIDWEIDYLAGTELPTQYATTQDPRPPGLAKKIITVQAAYAEAGIEVRTAGVPNQVALTGAGANSAWSDAELHAAMVANFSLHRDAQQWKLWTLIANRHETNGAVDGCDGIMFDWAGTGLADDFQRQGMAIFYDTAREAGYVGRREGLFSYIHEIGHALNIHHSWQKQPESTRGPQGGMADLSFMNYAENYPAGPTATAQQREAAFYAAFAWTFTANELRHLRHGFYYNVVPGGYAWGVGTAHTVAQHDADSPGHRPALDDSDLPVQRGPLTTSVPLADPTPPAPSQSGLRLDLSGSGAFSHGEPVTVQIRLSLDGTLPQAEATPNLSPGSDNLTILITDPAADTRLFQPLARRCGSQERVTLDATTPALYESAYIGYGAAGLTFTQPGTYRLQARYTAPDGSVIASPDHTIAVNAPVDDADKAAGDLLIGDQQGTLLALRGSDAPQLADGNAALDTLITDHPDHPLAVYALMAKGTNAGRDFLTLTPEGIDVRAADTDTSITQLSTVVETTLDPGTDAGVDNITLNETMRTLARAHADGGDIKQADAVLDQLVEVFADKGVPETVLATIAEQAEATRTQLHDQA
ncbi:hypothetical protein [Streptosporangium lutulentum]